MKPVLLDTDTLSFFFRGNNGVIEGMASYLSEFNHINMSVISYYEILNGLYYKDAKKLLGIFESFASMNNIVSLSSDIAEKAATIYADLRKKGKTIAHTDILIAGTAILHDMTLITNNTAHFKNIKGLHLNNWVK